MSDEDLVFRAADATDDADLRRVNADAFPHNPKARADITAWQYWGNPFGETIAIVCEDDGDIVGQYLAYRMPARFDGADGMLAIGVDLGVLESHRGRGLARTLTQKIFDECRANDLPVYSFASDNSVRVVTQCGWHDVCRMEVLVLPTGVDRLSSRIRDRAPVPSVLTRLGARAAIGVARRRVGVSSDRVEVAVAEPDTVPDGLDGLWSDVADHHRWGVVRSSPWWRWRYAEHPDRPYHFVTARRSGRLVAAATVGFRDDLGGDFACFYELLAVDEDAARAIVAATADGALRAPTPDGTLDGVAVACNPDTRLAALARASGLVRVPDRLLPTPLRFGVVPHPTIVPHPENHVWSSGWGDNDHI